MEKPDHIPQEIWDKHLDWFNVTGETSRDHIKDLKNGDLIKKYRNKQQARNPEKTEDGQS